MSFFDRFKKKAQMSGVTNYTVAIVLGLFVITVLIFALALAGAQMLASTTNATAQSVIGNMTSGMNQFASFSPIVWIITAIVLVLMILIGGLGYLFMRQG
jgi:hypothetical protein